MIGEDGVAWSSLLSRKCYMNIAVLFDNDMTIYRSKSRPPTRPLSRLSRSSGQRLRWLMNQLLTCVMLIPVACRFVKPSRGDNGILEVQYIPSKTMPSAPRLDRDWTCSKQCQLRGCRYVHSANCTSSNHVFMISVDCFGKLLRFRVFPC